MKIIPVLILALLAFTVPGANAAAPATATRAAAATGTVTAMTAMTEMQKIEALIRSIERLPDAVFIRNGSEHDSKRAGEHLRMKWKRAGKRVRNAGDFISCCASGSSMSGKPYQIRFSDGRVMPSAEFFRAQLRKIEAGKPTPAQPTR